MQTLVEASLAARRRLEFRPRHSEIAERRRKASPLTAAEIACCSPIQAPPLHGDMLAFARTRRSAIPLCELGRYFLPPSVHDAVSEPWIGIGAPHIISKPVSER